MGTSPHEARAPLEKRVKFALGRVQDAILDMLGFLGIKLCVPHVSSISN
jgi:hypothetical protein